MMRYGRGALAILGVLVIVAGLAVLGGITFFLGRLSQPPADSQPKRQAAAPTRDKTSPLRIEGEVVKKDATFYVIRERSGRETRLNIYPNTKIEDIPNIGDKVAATIEPLPSAVHTKSLEVTKGASQADSAKTEAIPEVVEGEIRDIRGENFTVQDIRGQQIKLHADDHTKKDGNLSVGDHVIARLNNSVGQGYVVSILKR
jgi:hypothetical protein